MQEIELLKVYIKNSNRIVFFGGAGVSTESGIPDFRSVNGLYHQQYAYPPETILSHSFYTKNPEEFYRYYKEKMICLDALPNKAHQKLAQLESDGKLLGVITQNIDGLHQAAGSRNVRELHGSVHRNYCRKCHKCYSAQDIRNSDGVPRCACGGLIKPDVVLYEEQLNQKTVQQAIKDITQAEILIVGGTSLAVYPAAGLLEYFQGDTLILINKETTTLDERADLCIQGKIGEILEQIN